MAHAVASQGCSFILKTNLGQDLKIDQTGAAMIKIERILCPTNLSQESDEALRYVVALARAYNARLFLFYCAEAAPAASGLNGDGAHQYVLRLFEEGLAHHLGLGDFASLDWEGIVVENKSDASEEIVREAAERTVDLIVMRSRRRPRAAALLGSTAERVCRTAPCPVLVTRPLKPAMPPYDSL